MTEPTGTPSRDATSTCEVGAARPLRVLALGDSYTVGEGVASDERWPTRVAATLRERGLEVAEPEIVAATGWTTDELAAGIEAADLDPPYDAVTLLIGVNNQYRGGDLEVYRREHADLLDQAIAFAGGEPARVVAVSFPDWGVTPFATQPRPDGAGRDPAQIALEVDAFNEAARATAHGAGVAWVDVTLTSRTQGDLVADDRLHPSGDAYAAWADLIAPALEDALRSWASRAALPTRDSRRGTL